MKESEKRCDEYVEVLIMMFELINTSFFEGF